MPHDEPPNDPDHDVLDLTRIKRERANKARDSDRGPYRKPPAEPSKGPRDAEEPHPGEDQAGPQKTLGREQIVLDRQQEELDRGQTALGGGESDQAKGKGDRDQAVLDREQAVLDRDQARLDRAQAALDRRSGQRKDYLIDDLTRTLRRGPGLRELQHEMDRARREGDPLVVAFIDVDGLKAINDSQGHAAGDQLLRDVADALRQGLRSYDLLLRYGGDEFVCALSNTEADRAHGRLREVADILATTPSRGSIAWGLAELRSADSLESLVARADSSLYRARARRSGPAD